MDSPQHPQQDPFKTSLFRSALETLRLLAPFFLSSLLYQSLFFSAFCPLPHLLSATRLPISAQIAALLANIILVGWMGGLAPMVFFAALVVGIGFIYPQFLLRRPGAIESAGFAGILTLCLLLLTGLLGIAFQNGLSLPQWAKQEFETLFQQLQAIYATRPETRDITQEELRASLLSELPSGILIISMVLTWWNTSIWAKLLHPLEQLRLGLSESFLKNWKAPELLVWPTLLAGAGLLFQLGTISTASLNLFKVLLCIFGIQGFCILAFLFDVWKLHPLLRVVLSVVLFVFLLPLVIGIGFFDLWFDFRAKFRQT